MLPLFGDRKPIPFVQSEFDECLAISLPTDDGWRTSRTNLGRAEVYVRPFPSRAGISPVSTGGGTQPRWRRDGKELFYLSLDGKLMVVEVNGRGKIRAGMPKALFQMRLAMDFDWSLATMRSRPTASAFSSPRRWEKLLLLQSRSC